MIKLQDIFPLTRRIDPVGVKQDLHSLQASGKRHIVHLWYVPQFELLQNRMDTKDPAPSSIGVKIPGSVRLAFWGGSERLRPMSGFPLWVVEGNGVGPLTSSTPRATGVESTVRWLRASQKTPSVQPPIVQTAFVIWDEVLFSGVLSYYWNVPSARTSRRVGG